MAIFLRTSSKLGSIHMSVRVVVILRVRLNISSTNSIPSVATMLLLQRRFHSNSSDSTTIPQQYLRSVLEVIGEDELWVAVGLRGGQRWCPLGVPASFFWFGWAVGAGAERLIMIFDRVLFKSWGDKRQVWVQKPGLAMMAPM